MHLIVLCGASGSGKTTLSKKLSKKQNLTRLSMDEMKIFSHSDITPFVLEYLKRDESVVVDALYTKRKWRSELLKETKDFQVKRILIYMNTPLDECVRRNSEKENAFPRFVIEDIHKRIELPSLDEGWDEIIYIDGGDNDEFDLKSN